MTSPIGNFIWSIVWGILLQALTILITYTVISRYFERKEESRWHLAKQHLYFFLFGKIELLLRDLTPTMPCQSNFIAYSFGEIGVIPSVLTNCRTEFDNLSWDSFIEPASKVIRAGPHSLSHTKRQLDILHGQSVVIMAREPEFYRLTSKLILQLEHAIQEINYRLGLINVDESTEDIAKQIASDIRYTAETAYDLWEWLAKQSTNSQDWTRTAKLFK